MDVSKGIGGEYAIRSRLVARDFKGGDKDREDLFAATPPLEAKRLLLSRAATRTGKGIKRGMLFVDVRKAHTIPGCDSEEYIELPPECGAPEGTCGKLDYWLYGCRPAAAASERAVLGSKELQAATDGFAADAEALMQQMAVALGALKQKHADVLSEAAVANSSRITTGAETHAGAMNKMFLEHDAAATEATETQAKEMAAGLSAFEESAGDAMSVSTAAVQASNSTLSEAMGGLKQSAQNFAQETSVETTASADATKQTLMDLNESCTHAAGECNALALPTR